MTNTYIQQNQNFTNRIIVCGYPKPHIAQEISGDGNVDLVAFGDFCCKV